MPDPDDDGCRWPSTADLARMRPQERLRWLRDEALWWLGLGALVHFVSLGLIWMLT